MRKYVFVTVNAGRKIFCLNIGNEELTLTMLQEKLCGLGGQDGWRREKGDINSVLRYALLLNFPVGSVH